MKLREFLGMVNDPVGDVVSIYDSTPTDPYHTLYEGAVGKCPSKLLDRDVCEFYPAFVMEGPGLCVGLDGYDGYEE